MNLEEAVHFTNDLFERSLPNTDNIFDIYEEDKIKLREKLIKVRQNLADAFTKQQNQICAFVENYWLIINEYGEVEIDWLDQWISEAKKLNSKLNHLKDSGQFSPSEFKTNSAVSNVPVERQELWFTFQFYIRNIMNQLGIHNLNEIHTYYLLKETLKNIND